MKRIKIGIADDNREFCEILTDYFRDKEDIDLAFVSHDGIKTVENIKIHQPEILILDMVMPHLDGLGVLETINNLHEEDKSAVGSRGQGREQDAVCACDTHGTEG